MEPVTSRGIKFITKPDKMKRLQEDETDPNARRKHTKFDRGDL